MRNTLSPCLAALVTAVLTTTPAQAQNTTSFMSSTGNDGNPCSVAAPCRTLIGAHDKTVAGGVVYCFDNGPFLGGTITKSITIDCSGTGGSANSISVTADATAAVHLRGLKITGELVISGTAAAKSIRVEGCDIVTPPTQVGLTLTPGPTNSNLLELLFVNTTFSNGFRGMVLAISSGAANITLDNVRIFNTAQSGIEAIGNLATTAPGLRIMVKNSIITGNGIQGVVARSSNGTPRVFVKDSVIAQNDVGLQADGAGAAIFVSGSTVTQNNHGLSAINGGRLFTYGNNEIQGNVQTNGVFTAAVPLQ